MFTLFYTFSLDYITYSKTTKILKKKKKARDSMTEDENEVQLKSKTAYKVCVECHPSPIPRNNCPQAKY